MAERSEGRPDPDPGDASSDASSRPPRNEWFAGVGPDPLTTPAGVGADEHPPAPAWLLGDEEPDEGRRRVRRNTLLALAIVPWLVVAVILLRPATGPSADAEATDVTAPTASIPAPSPPGSSAPTGEGSRGSLWAQPTERATRPLEVMGGARTAITVADATALATLVARDWLGGVGPRAGLFDAPLFPRAYVAQLAVEAVDHPAPEHVVVTLLALVLHSEGDGYRSAEVVRIAVPIAVDGEGAVPAGEPWRLAAPELAVDPPASGEIGDPTLIPEAAMALEGAGYRDVEVVRVEATDGWPFIVTADAVAPHSEAPERHVVWLRMHGSELVVAGALPPTNAPGAAAPTDDRQPSPGPTTGASPTQEGSP